MKKKKNYLKNLSDLVDYFKINEIKNDLIKWIIVLIVVLAPLSTVKSLPSFARQTQMSCTACHPSFPELNSFGRQFKMNGYTLTTVSTISDEGDSIKPRT